MNSRSEPPSPWVTVARLTNLAEVGYFADLLETEDYGTNVDCQDEFNAVDGSWNARYLLQVKPENGMHAAELIKKALRKTELDPAIGADCGDESNALHANLPRQSSIFYRAAISIIVIGAALLVAERVSRSRIGSSSTDGTLWDAIEQLHTEFRSSNAAGPGTRLFHDEPSDTIVLLDDVNRDGRVDRLRRYREGRLVETIER